jgi:hypothetical protein
VESAWKGACRTLHASRRASNAEKYFIPSIALAVGLARNTRA